MGCKILIIILFKYQKKIKGDFCLIFFKHYRLFLGLFSEVVCLVKRLHRRGILSQRRDTVGAMPSFVYRSLQKVFNLNTMHSAGLSWRPKLQAIPILTWGCKNYKYFWRQISLPDGRGTPLLGKADLPPKISPVTRSGLHLSWKGANEERKKWGVHIFENFAN